MSITAVDTNVIFEILLNGPKAGPCINALRVAAEQGELVISSIVFTELMASTHAPEKLTENLEGMGFRIETAQSGDVSLRAARAWRKYRQERRRQGGSVYHCPHCGHRNTVFPCKQCGNPIKGGPRHILADFLVGAHAEIIGATLLTLERGGGLYAAYFPELQVSVPG